MQLDYSFVSVEQLVESLFAEFFDEELLHSYISDDGKRRMWQQVTELITETWTFNLITYLDKPLMNEEEFYKAMSYWENDCWTFSDGELLPLLYFCNNHHDLKSYDGNQYFFEPKIIQKSCNILKEGLYKIYVEMMSRKETTE
jgi:hypothetical protein